MNPCHLLAGTAVADITPPLEVGLLTSAVNGLYAPFDFVRLPLKARVLVLKSGPEMVAIVSLDLLLLNDTGVGGWDMFKEGLSGVVSADRIILCCTHTHNAPESGGLTGLYLTEPYKKWLSQAQVNTRIAINNAANSARTCHVSVGTSILNGYSLQRRIKTPQGILLSDAVQPISPELMDLPPVDRRVTAIYFHDGKGGIIATVVHAVCHGVHEMCMPHVSSEFPGEMCIELESASEYGMPLFLNGAAGDTNPPNVSMGPEYSHRFGIALANSVQNPAEEFLLDTSVFRFVSDTIRMKVRSGSGMDNELNALARLNALRIGSLAILFLPGEPFVEIALEIERASPFGRTIIVCYSENSIGYIPTNQAFDEGGYEIGPGKWSFLEKGSDRIIINHALQLLEELSP